MNPETKIAIFKGKKIRKIIHNDEWWFSVIDVIEVLIESTNPSVYWRVLKKRLLDEGANETVTNCNGLKLYASDGKLRETDCANTELIFRIIQSVPSKKAEPFKKWLAKVGYERIQEIENPELAQERMKVALVIEDQNGKNSVFVTDTGNTFTLEEAIKAVENKSLENTHLVNDETLYIRSNPNKTDDDNLDALSLSIHQLELGLKSYDAIKKLPAKSMRKSDWKI